MRALNNIFKNYKSSNIFVLFFFLLNHHTIVSNVLFSSKQTYLRSNLYGGLNNQKLEILAACRFAHENQCILLEPLLNPLIKKDDFQIAFSEIFDLEYFCGKMKKYFVMVPFYCDTKKLINLEWGNLWSLVLEQEKLKNRENLEYNDDLEKDFYLALRLTKKNQQIVDEFEQQLEPNYVAIHFRIEDDWPKDNTKRVFFVESEGILEKYENSDLVNIKNIYLATAYKGAEKIRPWLNKGYKIWRHYDKINSLNYHIQSAIDFQICVDAEYFIGNSESSFSNLVTRTRTIMKKGHNYYYNTPDTLIHVSQNSRFILS